MPFMSPSGEVLISFNPSAPDSDTMMVSGGVSELEDISGSVVRYSRAVWFLNPMLVSRLSCRIFRGRSSREEEPGCSQPSSPVQTTEQRINGGGSARPRRTVGKSGGKQLTRALVPAMAAFTWIRDDGEEKNCSPDRKSQHDMPDTSIMDIDFRDPSISNWRARRSNVSCFMHRVSMGLKRGTYMVNGGGSNWSYWLRL